MSALELVEVVKHYGGSHELIRAVDGVSLRIEPSKFVALYGPSGSGKSTLLLLAGGLLAPTEGSVRFAGQDISCLSSRESARYRRQEVGFVFQSFQLIAGTSALNNAALKLLADGYTLREAKRLAAPWLERVGLSERARHKASELSMGERQRVAIARALVGRPRLLLCDEPTGNLDSKRSRSVLELLRDICHEQKIPALLVTHDPQARAFADHVYTLRDGNLAHGLDEELLDAAVSI